MKAQLNTLQVGTKFYFGNNFNKVCEVLSTSPFAYIAVKNGSLNDIDRKPITYKLRPLFCPGNLVTIIN